MTSSDVEIHSASTSDDKLEKRLSGCPLLLLVVLAGVFLVAAIVFATLFALEREENKTLHSAQGNDSGALCFTPYCIKTADGILDRINETVDPCEDFYEFACGTWINQTDIPNDQSSMDTLSTLQIRLIDILADLLSSPSSSSFSSKSSEELDVTVNARRLFNSCLDEETIDREDDQLFLSLINSQLGGWPILKSSSWNETTFNLSDVLLRLHQHGSSMLFASDTYISPTNSSTVSIILGQSDLALQDRSYYRDETEITQAYRIYISAFAQEFNNGTPVDQSDVMAIFQFEKKIANFTWTAIEQRLRNEETIHTTFANLSSTMNTTFNFVDYLRRVYLLANVTLNDTDPVSISELEYIRNISALVEEESPRTIQNYLIWRFLMNRVQLMSNTFRSIQQDFVRVFKGTSVERQRSLFCADTVNENMGIAVSKLYLEKYFDRTARIESLDMINNIRKVFIEIVNQSSWMDEESKSKAIEKARVIRQKVGYPEYLDDVKSTQLQDNYGQYIFNSSFLSNMLRVQQLKAVQSLIKLRQPIDRSSWLDLAPTVVNAFYLPSLNDIFFPAGILQPPFFHKDAPKYMNYGAIGMVIGHEITHGFDDIGRQYDKDGNQIPWWTNETITTFNQRKKCIIDQYSNYTVVQANEKVRGEQTQGEDIADNSGLRQAFLAYQRWRQAHPDADKRLPGLSKYSPEQLFFISYGQVWCAKMTDRFAKMSLLTDVHSPPRFRILGSTSNSADFDRAFGCKPGQGNSRVDKCRVW